MIINPKYVKKNNNSVLERKCTTKVYMTKNSSPVQSDLFKLMTNGKF